MSICVENVSYIYGKGTPFERAAIEDIDLTIDKGEFIGIIGHTGSGKSTLIQHLNGLLHPSMGKVTVDGVDLAEKTKEAMVKRHSVGMVFQYPEHQLFEETVAKDIAFGPRNQGCDEEETEKRVKSAMRFAGIDYETFAERSPFRLSGGQQRRVAIAGVIAMHPDFLIWMNLLPGWILWGGGKYSAVFRDGIKKACFPSFLCPTTWMTLPVWRPVFLSCIRGASSLTGSLWIFSSITGRR